MRLAASPRTLCAAGPGGDPGPPLVIVVLLFFASMINYFDRATLSFGLTDIAKDLHLDPVGRATSSPPSSGPTR